MLFLRWPASSGRCGKVAPAGPSGQTQHLLLDSWSSSTDAPSSGCPGSGSAASLPTDSGSTKAHHCPSCCRLCSKASSLAFVRMWAAGLGCHWRPREPLWFSSCPSRVCRQMALSAGSSHCRGTPHPCRTLRTGGRGAHCARLTPGRAESTWPVRTMFSPQLPLGIPRSMTHSPVPGQGPSQPSQPSPTQYHPD